MGILALVIIFLIGSLVAAEDGDYSGIEAIGKFVGFVVLMLACMWILTNPVVLVLVIVIIIVVCMVSK